MTAKVVRPGANGVGAWAIAAVAAIPRRASVLTVSMRLDNVPICAPRLAMSCGLKLAVARLPAASLVTNWVGPTCAALLASEVMPGAA